MNKLAVIGAGAWGTALAVQGDRAECAVTLVARDAATAGAIAAGRHNPRLPGVALPPAMEVADAIPSDAALLVWAVPMQQIRASLTRPRPVGVPILICAKGVEVGTHRLPLEVLADVAPDCPAAILSGPNFAMEVARGLPTASVIACRDGGLRDRVSEMLGTESFRLYGNDDPVGAQIGGAAKNVIAIAAGVVIGAGLGENARAALVTRGLAELQRLAVAMGGRAETVMGLSGLGDLLLSCAGPTSRNFSLGLAVGRGSSLQDALAAGTTVEGVATAGALLARAGEVDLPICRAVAHFLGGRETLTSVMQRLLSRPRRDE